MFAILGGLKYGNHLTNFAEGLTTLAQALSYYVGAVASTDIVYFIQKKKMKEQNGED